MGDYGNQAYRSMLASHKDRVTNKYNFVRDVIDGWASTDPEMKAILWTDESGAVVTRTFAEVSKSSARLANVLSENGVSRGDTVILILGRKIAWWESVSACLRMGCVASPGATQLSSSDIAYRIKASGAKAIITDLSCAEKVDAIVDECPSLRLRLIAGDARQGWENYDTAIADASSEYPIADTTIDDDAICYFTSGTTGYPKMTIHGQGYALGHKATGAYWLALEPNDLHWNLADTGWAKAAWSSYFGPWLAGACVFAYDAAQFDPASTLGMFGKFPIKVFCGAPTVYRMFAQEKLESYDFSTLRNCVSAGEPLNPEVIETWRAATGVTILDGYGQTETALLCANFPCLEPRIGAMGLPAPGIDLSIVDEDGNPVADNAEGNIAVRVKPKRPYGVFKEYKKDPDRTASAFVKDWYLTGDRGSRDSDGYFWFIGRSDDVILSAGYRIGPFEVESALIEHDAVVESAVVSSPDPTRGEVVKAFIVLAPGFEPSDDLRVELQDYVKSITAPYKYPRKIEFVETLPKTVSGKIRRVELRQKEWEEYDKPLSNICKAS